jgi:hypothetical protein
MLTEGIRGRITTGGGNGGATITGGSGMGVGITIGGVEGIGARINVGTGGAGGPGSRAGRTLGVAPNLGKRAEVFGLTADPGSREEARFLGLYFTFFGTTRRPLAGFASSEDCQSPAARKVATKNKINKWRLMIILLLL